jgi:glycosyltransferase involved in cell wall biosynthesis
VRLLVILPQSIESPTGLRWASFAQALVQRGHRVTCLALHHDLRPDTPRIVERDGFRVKYVGQMHVRKVGNTKVYFRPPRLLQVTLASTWQLVVQATREECDLIHISKPQPVSGLAGWLSASLLRRRPLFLDCDDYETELNRFSHRWESQAVAFVENALPRRVLGVTASTHFTFDRLAAQGVEQERMAYVPSGAARARFTLPLPQQVAALRSTWKLEGRPVVGYVGSMSLANHSVDLLIGAFARVVARIPDAVLLLVGGGEDYDRLRAQAHSLGLDQSVRFAGRVLPAETPAYFALADVTVDAVRDDPGERARSPLKVVESMAVGTPVVTGDLGDRREMLAGGRAGMLVRPGDPADLARGLLEILGSPGLARSLREGALGQREVYCADRLIDRILELYRRCGLTSC